MVRKKKKTKKKKPAESILLSQEEETRLNKIIEKLPDLNMSQTAQEIPSPQFAQALVGKLPLDHSRSVDLIVAIRDTFDQKNVQKEIKKVVFRLKQSGFSVPELAVPNDTKTIIQKASADNPSAFLGPIDGFGHRGVFLAIPQIPHGMNAGMGVINDENGIIQFYYTRQSKKRLKELKTLFFSNYHRVY